jgi:hypothetical protein
VPAQAAVRSVSTVARSGRSSARSFTAMRFMIISHKYRFIFVKTRKTAGTSIEIALSGLCGPDDVITPQNSENPANPVNAALIRDEQLRTDSGCTPAQHYHVPLSDYTFRQWRRLLTKRIRARHKKHAPASAIEDTWPTEWRSYYTFCVERNPWDKAISLYYWFTGGRRYKDGPMHQVLGRDLERVSNWHIYAVNDHPAVDQIILYENLEQELDRLADRLKLPHKLDLPCAKGEFRRDQRNYRDVIDLETKALIDRVCAKEIEYFGYRF